MSELYETNLIQWLQLSGEYISQMRPVEERAQWVEFLIKEIEASLPAEDVPTMLLELQAAIAQRLEHGVWPG